MLWTFITNELLIEPLLRHAACAMRSILIIIIAALLGTSIVYAQGIGLTQTVKGTIIDEQSGNVLSNATVIVEGVGSGVISDSLGNFKLKAVPIGRQTIRVSLVGYEEAFIRNVEITSSKEVVLEIRLKEKVKKLDEVVVRAGKQKN